MSYEHITVVRDGAVATVTLNRPQVANALNYPHLEELEHCALSFRNDAETRVVIFTGAGKHFSSGADLNEMLGDDKPALILRRRRWRMGERVMNAVLNMDPITVGALNGGALGGGACLATAFDFRIGSQSCFIQYPEIDIGINLMWQSLPLAVHLLGPIRAKRLVIGGERIGADELLDWGLLEAVVPEPELMNKALEFSETYVNKSPLAAQMIKRSINQISGAMDRALMHMDADQNLLTQGTADQREAADAYLNKRTPKFRGR